MQKNPGAVWCLGCFMTRPSIFYTDGRSFILIQFMRGDGILSSNTIPAAGQPIYDSKSNILAIGDGITDASNLYGVNAMLPGTISNGWRNSNGYFPSSGRNGVDLIDSWIIPNGLQGNSDLMMLYGFFYPMQHVPIGYDYPYGHDKLLSSYTVSVHQSLPPRNRDMYEVAYCHGTLGLNQSSMSNEYGLKTIPFLKFGIYSAQLNEDKTSLTLNWFINTYGLDNNDLTMFPDTTLIANWYCIWELL